MNNLKFRGYDCENNKMIYSIDIFNDEEIAERYVQVFSKNGELLLLDIDNNDKELELMQSTGLFDKYGVEIYEGDILTDEGNFENDYWDYATIEFDKIDYTYYIHWKREEVCENITDCYKYTVTGNIYENKELLENE